jgi:hypothetical protein
MVQPMQVVHEHNNINNNSKFNIVICELFNKDMHGLTEDSDPTVQGHYLIIHTSKNNSIFINNNSNNNNNNSILDEYDSDSDSVDTHGNEIDYVNINHMIEIYRNGYSDLINTMPNKIFGPNKIHPIIRNYFNIVSNVDNHIKLEIVQKIYLLGNECVAILKTFWIRIIQRKWKKIFSQKKQVIARRCLSSSIFHRQMTGNWPNNCLILPSLNGLLSDII